MIKKNLSISAHIVEREDGNIHAEETNQYLFPGLCSEGKCVLKDKVRNLLLIFYLRADMSEFLFKVHLFLLRAGAVMLLKMAALKIVVFLSIAYLTSKMK